MVGVDEQRLSRADQYQDRVEGEYARQDTEREMAADFDGEDRKRVLLVVKGSCRCEETEEAPEEGCEKINYKGFEGGTKKRPPSTLRAEHLNLQLLRLP